MSWGTPRLVCKDRDNPNSSIRRLNIDAKNVNQRNFLFSIGSVRKAPAKGENGKEEEKKEESKSKGGAKGNGFGQKSISSFR